MNPVGRGSSCLAFWPVVPKVRSKFTCAPSRWCADGAPHIAGLRIARTPNCGSCVLSRTTNHLHVCLCLPWIQVGRGSGLSDVRETKLIVGSTSCRMNVSQQHVDTQKALTVNHFKITVTFAVFVLTCIMSSVLRTIRCLFNGKTDVGEYLVTQLTAFVLEEQADCENGRSDASADRVRPKLAEAQALCYSPKHREGEAKEDDGNAGPPSRSATAENMAMAAEAVGRYGKKK